MIELCMINNTTINQDYNKYKGSRDDDDNVDDDNGDDDNGDDDDGGWWWEW